MGSEDAGILGNDINCEGTTMISIITPIRAKTLTDVDWLVEAVDSVVAQTYEDWEMVICNDHSTADMSKLREHLADLGDPRIAGCKTDRAGVCAARNAAAEIAQGDLLLPLDADDLLPPSALQRFMDNWEGKGIVYGDTLVFGRDFQKRYRSRDYNFGGLLRNLIMPVGALHRKSDWERIGGWHHDMEDGLEDWEYWIRMGKHGVCGKHIPYVTYHYRRRKGGRYVTLKETPTAYQKAYQKIREIHKDVYNGRFPVGCCGRGTRPSSVKRSPVLDQAMRATVPQDGSYVEVQYTGGRKASFQLVGKRTGTRYNVPGANKLVVNMDTNKALVEQSDARMLETINHGRDFRIIS